MQSYIFFTFKFEALCSYLINGREPTQIHTVLKNTSKCHPITHNLKDKQENLTSAMKLKDYNLSFNHQQNKPMIITR